MNKDDLAKLIKNCVMMIRSYQHDVDIIVGQIKDLQELHGDDEYYYYERITPFKHPIYHAKFKEIDYIFSQIIELQTKLVNLKAKK